MVFQNLADCHAHTNFSPDSEEKLERMCEAAFAKKIKTFTITDHCECNFYRDGGKTARSVIQSVEETREQAEKYRGKMQLLSGVEIGQAVHDFESANEAVSLAPYDFILGSIHNIRGAEDFYFMDMNFDKLDIHEQLQKYVEEIKEVIAWGKFDSLAHLTYPLRYIPMEKPTAAPAVENFLGRMDEILELLVKSGKALEVNTSGLRQKVRDTAPSFEIIKRFYELGGKYVTIGADAHKKEDVGAGIEEGLYRIRKAGFTHYTVYVGREPHLIPIE